jgi:iron complex outermembrane receptor protein
MIAFASSLNAIMLEPVSIEETLPSIATTEVDEELQTNAQTLAEKLTNQVNITQIDSSTNASVLSIRGNNFRATDYYEDGVPLFKTANGFVDTSMYIDDSLKVDINLGGDTSLYAPSATGGEIVLTSKRLKDGLNGYINASLSTNNRKCETLVSYKINKYYVKGMLNGFKQERFILSNDFAYTAIQPNKERVNSDKKQLGGYLKVGYKMSKYADIAFKVSYLKGNFGVPVQVYDESSHSDDANATADYVRADNKELNSYWFYYDYKKGNVKLRVRSYYDAYTDTFNFYDSPSFTTLKYAESVYEDNRLGSIVSVGYNYSSKNNALITLRLDRNRHTTKDATPDTNRDYETVESSLSYLHKYQYNSNVLLTASLQYKMQNLTQAYKYSNQSIDYKDNKAVDGQLTCDYAYDKKQSYYFSIARKTRFASLVELYPFFPWSSPTQNVKPEKSNSVEVGTAFKVVKNIKLKLATFYNRVNDMILFDSNKYENSDEVTIKGLELSVYNYYFDNQNIELSYAYTDARDKENEQVRLIPTSKLNITDEMFLKSDVSLLLTYLFVGSRNDVYNSKTYKLDSYSLIDTQLSYFPKDNLTIKGGVKNLFDENAESRHGQPAPGRSLFASLRYSF